VITTKKINSSKIDNIPQANDFIKDDNSKNNKSITIENSINNNTNTNINNNNKNIISKIII